MHEATSWQAVEDFLGGNPTAVVVVDPDVAGGTDCLRRLRRCSTSDVVIYSAFQSAADVLEARAMGIRLMVTLGADDSKENLCAHIRRAIAYDELARFMAAAERVLTVEQMLCLRWAIRLGEVRLSVDDLARESGISTRSLSRRWESVPGMTTQRVLQSARLLHASRMLATTPMSYSAVAHAVGFKGYEALRRAFKRATGLSLHEIDRARLFDEVAKLFRLLSRICG
jgi:AraC-like DNA-binding protein